MPTKTLTDITIYQDFVDNIKKLFISDDEDVPEVQYPEYDINKFLEEVYISEDEYYILVKLLQNKKNIMT